MQIGSLPSRPPNLTPPNTPLQVHTSHPHTIKDLLHIHTVNTDVTNSCTKSCHSIATQLVRLVGHQAFLRPVLASLFHRIIMFPPPHLRRHALEGVKVFNFYLCSGFCFQCWVKIFLAKLFLNANKQCFIYLPK